GPFRRRLGETSARSRLTGGAAIARQDPQRRIRRQGQACPEPAARRPDASARLRERRALPRRGSALREGDRDDGRRRRRRPYPLPVDPLLLPAGTEADRERPPLSRRAAALPLEPRRQEFLCAR